MEYAAERIESIRQETTRPTLKPENSTQYPGPANELIDDELLEEEERVSYLSNEIRSSSFSENFSDLLIACKSINTSDVLNCPPKIFGSTIPEHIIQPAAEAKIFHEVFLDERYSVPLKLYDLSVIDVETTGLGSDDEVVEIAAVRFDSSGDVINCISRRVKPYSSIKLDASRTHGIRNSDLLEEARFDDVWPEIYEVIKGSVVFAHNCPFDVKMINQSLKQRNPYPPLLIVDNLLTYRLHTSPDANLYKLSTLARGLGINVPGHAHSALHDCLETASLVLGLLKAKPDLGISPERANSYNFELETNYAFESEICPSQIQIPVVSLERGEFVYFSDMSKFKFKFSHRGVRFFIDRDALVDFSNIEVDLEDLGLSSAKRLTPSVKYIFSSGERVASLMADYPQAAVIQDTHSADKVLMGLQRLFETERRVAVDTFTLEQEMNTRRRWERAINLYPRLRLKTLDPIQYVHQFYYKRWD